MYKPPVEAFHFYIKSILLMIVYKLSVHGSIPHDLLWHTSYVHLKNKECALAVEYTNFVCVPAAFSDSNK